MILRMQLNGKDIAEYNLTPLDGCLQAFLKPADYKALQTNDNAAIHGTNVLSAPQKRRMAKRDITLPFLLRSTSFVDLQRDLDTLVGQLINGKNNSGVNEIYLPLLDKYYRLVYVGADKYNNFGMRGCATLYLKFTEPNPNNRSL